MENNLTLLTSDLTGKQQKFAECYVSHLNATLAAEQAGYSTTSLSATGHELLRNSKVAAYITQLKKQQLADMGITPERVLRELARIAFVDPDKMYDEFGCLKSVKDMDEDTRRAIASIETKELFEQEGRTKKYVGDAKKVRTNEKTKAIEMMMRHFNLFEADNKSAASNTIIVTNSESVDIWKSLQNEFF